MFHSVVYPVKLAREGVQVPAVRELQLTHRPEMLAEVLDVLGHGAQLAEREVKLPVHALLLPLDRRVEEGESPVHLAEVKVELLADCFDETIPVLLVVIVDGAELVPGEDNDRVELRLREVRLQQLELDVQLALLRILGLGALLHDALVRLGDHRDQEVQEDHGDEQLVEEEEEPAEEDVELGPEAVVHVVDLDHLLPLLEGGWACVAD